ncbi:hypothetical protein OOT46_16765 [Aquabacterium sp. A7-Y]|nr:hypothetical protein [Aquabacterium sp. A7-Y]MCW7539496.1 hypothetical protein [Aquabacterium sp. A7-Y]
MLSVRHFAIAALVALPLVSHAAPTNLLRNGGFEEFDYLHADPSSIVHLP